MNSRTNYEGISGIARRSLVLVGLLAAELAVGGLVQAQTRGAALPAVVTSSEAEPKGAPSTTPVAAQATSGRTEKTAAKSGQEGIKIHGHWIIDVRDPDGKLVSHRDFENAIDPNEGADLLTGVLSGEYAVEGFIIDLYAPGGQISNLSPAPTDIMFFDSRNPIPNSSELSSGVFGLLTYTPNASTTGNKNAIGYTLSGNFTIPQNVTGGTITTVGSGLATCAPLPTTATPTTPFTSVVNATSLTTFSASPTGQTSNLATPCVNQSNPYLLLTSTTISQTVSTGQNISVTVIITFS